MLHVEKLQEQYRRQRISLRPVHRRKCCQHSTDDGRQFITLTVKHCVQRDGREAVHRNGSSAVRFDANSSLTARRYAKRGICRRRVSMCLSVFVCVFLTPVLYQNG